MITYRYKQGKLEDEILDVTKGYKIMTEITINLKCLLKGIMKEKDGEDEE